MRATYSLLAPDSDSYLPSEEPRETSLTKRQMYSVKKKDSEEWWVGYRKGGERQSKEKIDENRETVMDSQ